MGSAISSKTLETNLPPSEETDQSAQAASDESNDTSGKEAKNEEDEGEEEEEEGECGFCLFMKGGGCKDSFIAWENCIESVEKEKGDIVEKCFQVTADLKKCMDAHSDYYEPILRAEKAAEVEAIKELEKEAAAAAAAADASKDKSLQTETIIQVEQEPAAAVAAAAASKVLAEAADA